MLIGCHGGQSALVDHPRSFPGVVNKDVSFYSSALDRNMTYRVYLPRGVSADQVTRIGKVVFRQWLKKRPAVKSGIDGHELP